MTSELRETPQMVDRFRSTNQSTSYCDQSRLSFQWIRTKASVGVPKVRAPSLGPSAINPLAVRQRIDRRSGLNIEETSKADVIRLANSVLRERGLMLLAIGTQMAYLWEKQRINPPTTSTNGMTSSNGIIRQ